MANGYSMSAANLVANQPIMVSMGEPDPRVLTVDQSIDSQIINQSIESLTTVIVNESTPNLGEILTYSVYATEPGFTFYKDPRLSVIYAVSDNLKTKSEIVISTIGKKISTISPTIKIESDVNYQPISTVLGDIGNVTINFGTIKKVNTTTPNLKMIQSFPVVSRMGNVHIHQDPNTGELYEMTDEFHSDISKIINKSNQLSTIDIVKTTNVIGQRHAYPTISSRQIISSVPRSTQYFVYRHAYPSSR